MSELINCYQYQNNVYLNIIKAKEKLNSIPELHVITINDEDLLFNDIKELADELQISCVNSSLFSHEKDELFQMISEKNTDNNIGGIYLTPLTYNFLENSAEIYSRINPSKDIDAKNVVNIGLTYYNQQLIWSSTVSAILKIIEELNIEYKKVAIVDYSYFVFLELATALSRKNCSINLINSQVNDLKQLKNSDLVITNINKINSINASFLQKDSTIIDLGYIYLNEEYHGDITDNVCEVVKYYTEPKSMRKLILTYLFYNFIRLVGFQRYD